jgi:hypothetical protein
LTPRADAGRAAGLGAALLWALTGIRWFDAGEPWRPAWLAALPLFVLAVAGAGCAAVWLRSRWPLLAGPRTGDRMGLLLVAAAAVLFRLPLAWQGGAGGVTADGALSGIVSLHVRDGIDHLVFVPHVPYSGSLKSHLTAPLATLIDPARAFTLVSVFFYGAFVAGVYRLALLVPEAGFAVARAAGLYLVFAPAFVTRYSVSNDGNYVEVLAFGTWALWLAARGTVEANERRPLLAFAAGLLLGLAFWCHILALVHIAAVGAAFLIFGGLRAGARSLGSLAAGLALGYWPGLLWNAGHHGESFQYMMPGGPAVGASEGGPGLLERAAGIAADQWPALMGYDPGHGPAIDKVLLGLAWLAAAAVLFATASAGRLAFRQRSPVLAVLLLFTAANLGIALFALPHIPGNARYLLFLMAPLPVFLAHTFGTTVPGRALLFALIAFGAVGSVLQLPAALRADDKWRSFVAALERDGVRHCYTDFYLATKINFLSEERVQCTAKLGPTTTEYFFEYRDRVERAKAAAFVAVNPTAASRIERRLKELGVDYERQELMKPVFLRLSRKVDPEELFPGREFPWR